VPRADRAVTLHIHIAEVVRPFLALTGADLYDLGIAPSDFREGGENKNRTAAWPAGIRD